MFRIPVAGRRCEPLTIELTTQTPAEQLAIFAFGPNGELVARTPGAASRIQLAGRNDEVAMTQTPVNSLSRLGDSYAVKAFQKTQNAQFEGRFCPPESYTAFETKQRADSDLQLTFLAEHRNGIWIAITHADNLKFDPVTGRGDNRSDIKRDRVTFDGAVRMSE